MATTDREERYPRRDTRRPETSLAPSRSSDRDRPTQPRPPSRQASGEYSGSAKTVKVIATLEEQMRYIQSEIAKLKNDQRASDRSTERPKLRDTAYTAVPAEDSYDLPAEPQFALHARARAWSVDYYPNGCRRTPPSRPAHSSDEDTFEDVECMPSTHYRAK